MEAPGRVPWKAWAAWVGLVGLRCLWASRVELAPQEAYYWQYARHLDLSYFDHPPMAAWWIALSIRLFGSTELGVRAPAIGAGVLQLLLLYRLAHRLYGARVAELTAVLASCTVLFSVGAVVMTPDVPLALFFTAFLCVLAELTLEDGRGPGAFHVRWFLLGGLCGLALLSKYTAALLLPQGLLALLLTRRGRAALRTPGPFFALATVTAVFSPVLIWNAQHGWASFLFQSVNRLETVQAFKPHLLGRYLGLQAIAVGPLLYLALWMAAGKLLRDVFARDERAALLATASLPGLLLFSLVAPWHWVKLNWVGPIYLPLVIAVAVALSKARSGWRRWAAPSMAVSGAVLALALHLMPLVPEIPFRDRDDWITGWHQLARAVDEARGAETGRRAAVIGWGYKTASELAFYLRDQPRTLSNPALGAPGLAYDFWTSEDDPAPNDTTAILVADDREPLAESAPQLAQYCRERSSLPDVTVRRGDHEVTRFHLWRCERRRVDSPALSLKP